MKVLYDPPLKKAREGLAYVKKGKERHCCRHCIRTRSSGVTSPGSTAALSMTCPVSDAISPSSSPAFACTARCIYANGFLAIFPDSAAAVQPICWMVAPSFLAPPQLTVSSAALGSLTEGAVLSKKTKVPPVFVTTRNAGKSLTTATITDTIPRFGLVLDRPR